MTVRYAADLKILELILSTDPIEGPVQPNHTGPIEGQVQPNFEQEQQAVDMRTVVFSWRNNGYEHKDSQVQHLHNMLVNAGLVVLSSKDKLGGQNLQRIKVFMTFERPDK